MVRRKGKRRKTPGKKRIVKVGVKAEVIVKETCEVGGCDEDGYYNFNQWRVCAYHFAAYLDDIIDLSAYFQIKQSKMAGEQEEQEDEEVKLDLLGDEVEEPEEEAFEFSLTENGCDGAQP
jgi:hypothetical protein